MRKLKYLILTLVVMFIGCSEKPEEVRKGFTVNNESPEEENNVNRKGIESDSLHFESRPNGILITGNSKHRLVPVYKLNMKVNDDDDTSYYTGSNSFYSSYQYISEVEGDNWHNNFMPGFEVMYGYNLININHYDIDSHTTKSFFDDRVLIKTLYYPTTTKDSLHGEPITRDYYMVSAYNEDSNDDGVINTDDLRRFFLFNQDGTLREQLIPNNYSVNSSQFDSYNDYMYVYATLDEDKSGSQDETEDVHVFWIDLKKPTKANRLY